MVIMTATIANAEGSDGYSGEGRFDIGGRSIQLTCRGTGAPTLVIDAGMGTVPAEDPAWQGIAKRVAKHTRVCLYDRVRSWWERGGSRTGSYKRRCAG